MKLGYWFFSASIALCVAAFAFPGQKQHFVDMELALSVIFANIGAMLSFNSLSHRIDELVTEMYHDQESMYRHIDRRVDENKSNCGKTSK